MLLFAKQIEDNDNDSGSDPGDTEGPMSPVEDGTPKQSPDGQ